MQARVMTARQAGRVVCAMGLVAACAAPALAHAAKPNPETKRLPPTASAGHFLGFPSPTYSWHGCTATASKPALAALQKPLPGVRPNTQGTQQGAVRFTTTVGAPYIAWTVKPGWSICGVQAAVVLDNPDVDSLLVAEVGYTSGRKRGSTAADGEETITVSIPEKGVGAGFERFEGKTFTIDEIRDVTVFVRRARP